MELNQFKITVVPLRGKLLNYARKLTDDSSDAEDVVQEVMLKLWNIRQKLEEYNSIEALAVVVSQTVNPERVLEGNDEIRLMREIISSLPTLQQTIIRMKDIEEYETEEIAQITGCSSESIRSNLSRARKKVRDIYLKIKMSET